MASHLTAPPPRGCHIVFYPNTFAIIRQKRRKTKKVHSENMHLIRVSERNSVEDGAGGMWGEKKTN